MLDPNDKLLRMSIKGLAPEGHLLLPKIKPLAQKALQGGLRRNAHSNLAITLIFLSICSVTDLSPTLLIASA